jgi:alkylation response protein AidB-like acyl-CoA dehydrogenase
MYQAPVKDLLFVLGEQLRVGQLSSTRHFAEFSLELSESVLDEAARFATGVLEPINTVGDREGAQWTPDGVRTAPGFVAAYKQYVADGWPQLGISAADGGQGAPLALATAVEEIWFATNMAFILCPQLGRGAVEALLMAGTPELKARFLPKMISGEWTGTMNLTEPQAGSDLAAVRTRAVPDGAVWRLFGQKIFITYGEHDMADNIVHLVLARIEGAPPGVKGLSLFVVPRFMPDGGARNDMRCVSIEHKMGIHGSPTCVLAYGDKDGAVGYLVGEANHGLEYMFIMMNSARLSVGVQGIGLSARAYQQALGWARTRVQGKPVGAIRAAGSDALPTIIQHPDVKRLLLMMKSNVEAMRALALYAALQQDLGAALNDGAAKAQAQTRADLLIPIVKGWSTEQVNDVASMSIQVHGGMGYIEETGVAQTMRDARITAIYEGTTAIQANDLIGRKLLRDGGAAMSAQIDTLQSLLQADAAQGSANTPDVQQLTAAASAALEQLRAVSAQLVQRGQPEPVDAFAVSVPYLMLCGFVFGGALLVQGANIAANKLAAGNTDVAFMRAKLQTARFYAAHWLPRARGLADIVAEGARSVSSVEHELL